MANTFLFVISPDSATSDICGLETAHAVNPYKQMVPAVWKDADDVHEVCQLRIGAF
ncbi:MAG: hypothetical protein QGI86_09715 [Candidatus Poribacteria bacterium]|nr:hypothetical protein [Candidatus Poribacteria bacterium]MDP6750106.1 hypothetical protein [Candidatus Poribacteria bacterium]MDP6996640.1 hypothetical protein [Candidatus Poribacteria bacterium]